MRASSVAACLWVTLGSLGGCVAATEAPEGGAGSAGHAAPEAGAGTGVDGGRLVVPGVLDSGAVDAPAPADAAAHPDAAKAPDAAGPGDASAADGAPSPPADSAPPPPVDAGPTCPPGETLCGASCFDTMTDPESCGGCASVCPAVPSGTATCSAGACGFSCDASFHACGAACASDASVESCGASCTACAAPVLGTATCDGTSCGIACNPGTVLCAGGTACCASVVLAAGHAHTCAVTASGVECVGLGSSGQIGDDLTSIAYDPAVAAAWTPATLVAGYDHTCALTSAGALACWGDNLDGDLGDTTTTQRNLPVWVVGLGSGVIGAAAGYAHTCALLATGGVDCWGDNLFGQVGNGSKASEETSPVSVSGITSAVALAAGGEHTCAALADGSVSCWGYDLDGQLGDGLAGGSSDVPVKVAGLGGVVALSAGARHTCALTSAGAVSCWGFGDDGELGDGSLAESDTPVAVSSTFGGDEVVAISSPADGDHTCALTSAGAVYCWGLNGDGQLGDGSSTSSDVPVKVTMTGATAIATGDRHSCAAKGATVYCWGSDADAELGNGLSEGDIDGPVSSLF